MDIEQTKQAIEIMQAFADGKEIEFWEHKEKWIIVSSPCWDWDKYQYRIKPSLYNPQDLPENRIAKIIYPNSTYHENIVIRYGRTLINIGRGKLRWWDNIDKFDSSFKCQLIDQPITLDPKDN